MVSSFLVYRMRQKTDTESLPTVRIDGHFSGLVEPAVAAWGSPRQSRPGDCAQSVDSVHLVSSIPLPQLEEERQAEEEVGEGEWNGNRRWPLYMYILIHNPGTYT